MQYVALSSCPALYLVSVLQEGTPTLNNTKTTNWLNKKVIADSLYSHVHKSS